MADCWSWWHGVSCAASSLALGPPGLHALSLTTKTGPEEGVGTPKNSSLWLHIENPNSLLWPHPVPHLSCDQRHTSGSSTLSSFSQRLWLELFGEEPAPRVSPGTLLEGFHLSSSAPGTHLHPGLGLLALACSQCAQPPTLLPARWPPGPHTTKPRLHTVRPPPPLRHWPLLHTLQVPA